MAAICLRDDVPLADQFIYAAATCPDGALLAAGNDALFRYDGASWLPYGSGWDGPSPDDVACAADGTLWMAYFGGLRRFDGSWVDYGAAALGPAEDATDLVVAVDVAADGQVWVATAASVATLADDGWRVFAAGSGFAERLFISDLVVGADGSVWVAHSGGLARWDGTSWQLFAAPSGSGTLGRMAAAPDGRIWLGSFASGLLAFRDGRWATFNAADGFLPSDRVSDVAVDDQGRIWAGTSYGLVVYDGASWRWYQMHNADLVDNALQQVVVSAGGPPLPEPLTTAPGVLRGTLRDSDAATPLADRPVEICAAPVSTIFIDDAPCAGQPFVRTTRSDGDGRFFFDDLPAARYAVTYEVKPGAWGFYAGRFGFAERALLPAGGDVNLGDLVYDPDN